MSAVVDVIKPETFSHHMPHSSYGSMENCFKAWFTEEYDVPRLLLTYSKENLISFINTHLCIENKTWSMQYVWEDCFGPMHSTDVNFVSRQCMNYDSITKEELVYFILNLENHTKFNSPSIWTLIEVNKNDSNNS